MRGETLALTAAQRAALERARNRDPRPYLRERAAALLQIAGGASARRVALSGLGRPRQARTVRAWLAAYRAGGLDGLAQRPRGHRGLPPL
jgi:transposase